MVVEAPQPGNPQHAMQKQYDKFHAEVVFNGGQGRMAPAGPKEIEILGRHLLRGAQRPGLDLTLTATADPLIRLSV